MDPLVVHGASHVVFPVKSLSKSRAVYAKLLGFPEKASGEGWVDLDAGGTILVRLLEVARPDRTTSIRVQVADVDRAHEALVRAGCTHVVAPTRTPAQEHVAAVKDPDGHVLEVWRPLTEDEYDFVPELPKELSWDPEADALLKSLLRAVPALFRGLARRRVAATAEELAERTRLVTREEVIRGFILASPRVTRGRNRQPLVDHGIDVDAYKADWEAP